MTPVVPTDYAGEEQPPGLAGLPRRGPEPWRVGAAALIVAVVLAAIWLWGRPQPAPPAVRVAVTAEAWLAGQPPGAFEVVEVPQALSEQLADPDSIAGSVAAFDMPAGSFVTPAMLGPSESTSGASAAIRFSADTSAWPEPGPNAGSRAVVAGVLGGCALDVTTLAGGAEGSIVVHVDPAGAARYANAAELDGLVVWPAPSEGWPECRSATVGAVRPYELTAGASSRFGDGSPSGLRNEMPPGIGGELPPPAPVSDSVGE
ncbi:MAG: hypothetical protein F4W98_10825 [Acidimicrobiales bacterium]|nr:hypothetical protein [Acidimicrobiales bacterium]